MRQNISSVASLPEHYQCTIMQNLNPLMAQPLFEFTVFGARIENDPAGFQGQDEIIVKWLVLYPDVEGDRIDGGQLRKWA